MPELIATRRLAYGTRRLQAGDRFPASKTEAAVLVALKHARPAPADLPEPGVPAVVTAPAAKPGEVETIAAGVGLEPAAPRRGRPPKVRD